MIMTFWQNSPFLLFAVSFGKKINVRKKSMCDPCDWQKEVLPNHTFYYCASCSAFSRTKPIDFVEEEEAEDAQTEIATKCRHNWVALGNGRCHNKGGRKTGKYVCYRCTECNAFQKR